MRRICLSHARCRTVTAAGGRPRSELGATIVEAAFAVPIFFLLLLGLVDIGMGVFQTSQATSASADGARVAIVWPTDASKLPSHYVKIRASVRERLVGQNVADSEITISCETAAGASIACDSTSLNPLRDRVRVEVRWRWQPTSFVGAALPVQDIKGSTTMSLVSQPRPEVSP